MINLPNDWWKLGMLFFLIAFWGVLAVKFGIWFWGVIP